MFSSSPSDLVNAASSSFHASVTGTRIIEVKKKRGGVSKHSLDGCEDNVSKYSLYEREGGVGKHPL